MHLVHSSWIRVHRRLPVVSLTALAPTHPFSRLCGCAGRESTNHTGRGGPSGLTRTLWAAQAMPRASPGTSTFRLSSAWFMRMTLWMASAYNFEYDHGDEGEPVGLGVREKSGDWGVICRGGSGSISDGSVVWRLHTKHFGAGKAAHASCILSTSSKPSGPWVASS